MPTPTEQFTRRIRQIRKAHGWSQTELAQRLTAAGVPMTMQTISNIECRRSRVSLDEAVAIAQVVEVSLDDLLSDRQLEITRQVVTIH